MRPLLFLASLATIATVAYYIGPSLAEAYQERETLVAERPTALAAPAGSTSEPTPPLHLICAPPPARPATPFKATPDRGAERVQSNVKMKPKVWRRRTAAAERAELGRLGLTPAAGRVSAARPAAQPAVRPRPNHNPMAGRWVDELSGPKARLDMGVKGGQGSCAEAYSHCQRPDAPADISVAGVVVRTETLAGKVRRGHFLDETPAVYVE